MENEPSLLDVADEEFAQINKPEQKQDKGSILDIADDEFKKQEEESNQKEFDVAKLEKLKAEGKPLSEVQQRMIFDEQDKVPLLQQAGSGIKKFIPAAATKVGELSRGAYELAREGAVKPVYVGAKYHLGLATPKETNIAARDAEIALRSGVSGFMSDLEDTAGTIIKGYESGSSFTDKLQGLSADERFKRYRWRERFQGYQQARRDENPDRAAAVLAENVLLQKAAGIATKMQGGNEEDAKAAEKAYSELVLESGLTREELNPYISALGEVISPISIPGANIATKTIGKYTGKAVQKGGELALKGVVKPVAAGVEKAAELTEKGITGVQTGARKLGEYVTGDPDTLIRGGSIAGLISAPQITGTILAAKPAAIATKQVARTFKDIASAVDVGGAAGRRGLVERAGRSADSGALTKRLFSAESRGGLGRARAADWMIRQGNAITQQGVNGAVLNTILGLPDIESIEQGLEAAGSGFGMGAFGGSRIMDRAGAIIDPRTSLAQKIDTIITPDPSSRRADEDADIKRFLSSVDPDLVPRMEKLGSIDERKKAIQTKIDDLEKKKDVTFGPDVQDIKSKISKLKTTIETLDKATPQTQKEILRQVHLAFAEEMDLAKTTGKAAGLNNIQVKILDPSEMEGFFRNSYGATLTDAESVISQLTGNPNLSPQESESLVNARKVVDRFYNEVGSLQSARGGAISDGSETPAFMRKQNLQGATIVINGDLVKQLSGEGFNVRNVVGHEMQHALSQFSEVRDMLAPIRRELFDQNIVNDDGTINKVTQGVYSDEKLDAYADTYAAAMSPSDNGESFKAQFGDQDKLRAYIKEEVLSEIAGRSGRINGGKRAGLDSIGRQVVDWIEVKTQNGVLKTIKETLRKGGIIVDDSGDISTVLGAELTPESLAMIRQYQRQLNNLNQSMVYEGDARKEEVEIPLTKILSDRSLQEKFKNSDIFEKEQVATMTAPDGSKQEIPLPPEAGVDPFVGTYRIQGGQLVDEKGIPMNLGPEITFGTMPDGTQVEVGTRIARNVDGSPKILSNREIEARSRNRGKVIRNAIDSALSKGALQLEDTGNGNYRGVMSEAQVNAVLALPNTIVSPNLKRQILFVNEILRRKDGTRMYMEYQAAMRGGKSRALAPQIRDEIPIGFQFSKQGNFLITTISVSRMHDKMNAWLAKKPENLKLWNGDTANFWSDVIKVLDNHSKGDRGETGLDTDAAVALEKKNAVNDLFNVWNADTKAANPRRTKLPVQKGKDPIDVIVRSRRIDRINQYNESALQKMPFNYELNRDNYMPAENPLADFQTPEDFANDLPSVTAEEIRNAINTGNLDQLESKLREGDDLKPAESLDEENGNIRIVSMFDPAFMPEDPMESEPEVSVSETQFMPAETERYPTSERGMYSGLQKTIDEKVTGKFASPEQLKAIVSNPQNAKAEELKWSGVLGEIDRLAAENQGKVPKDKVMDYLRNEGAVKFEEVTLGGTSTFLVTDVNGEVMGSGETESDAIADAANALSMDFLDVEDIIEKSKRGYQGEEETLFLKEDEGDSDSTRFAGLQLPGGTNYREVVMTMPVKQNKPPFKQWFEEMNLGSFDDLNETQKNRLFDQYKNEIDPTIPSYTSSHFPDTPNYVAHMRLNERTDAQGNKGDFVEEFQSDRHQAGREKGYALTESERSEIKALEEKAKSEGGVVRFNAEDKARWNELGAKFEGEGIPDAPFRKDWSIQLFKRALRDAVDADKKWIGWTTGIEQVKRYEQAMRQAVDEITWNTPKGYQKAFAAIKDGNTILTGKINDDGTVYDFSYDSNFAEAGADANGKQLSEVLGKEVASKILAENSGTATGDDLTVGGEGMKGFYDTILPKEVGKYVAKMGGKVEKSEITTQKESTWTQVTRTRNAVPKTKISPAKTTPIWRVNITPEMAGKVRGGQLQFMPAEQPTKYEPISARIRPLEGISAPTKVVGAKALSLGEIEPPVRGKAMLPDMELGTTESDDKLSKLKEFAPKTEDKEGYIGVKSIGNREGQLEFADLLDSNVEQTKNRINILKKQLDEEKKAREKELLKDKIRFNNDLIQQFGDASKTIRYLDNNNIPFQIDNSLRTGSVYIKTGTKDFRFSSHSQTPYGFKTLNGFDDVLSHFEPILTPDSSEKSIQSSDITNLQFMPAEGDYPSVGININDKTQDFTDQILRGEKTIETRPINSLKSLIGKRVGIVRTGKGKATLVGYANLQEPIVYNNAKEFRADQDKHLVEAGSDFDIKPDKKKYGYPLTDVESIDPIEIPSDLPNWRSARSIPQTQFMPAEGEESQEISIPDAILKGSGEFAILRQSLEGKKPSVQEREKEQIPVAKTDTEEESSDSSLISTGVDVPESVDEQSNISNALTIANSQSWRKGRDFKLEVQNRVLEAAKKAGVQISERTAEAIEYLARVGLKDGLLALDQNPNAIGWYDEKTKQALGVMSLLFPEIATDQNARFAFTWAMAVTSNGLKVDKNFELAERVYREFRKTGKMPTNIEAGQAQKAINEGLDLFNKLTKDWGVENTRKFMQTDFTVGEISRLSKDLSPGGEFSDTNVRGSAILGPKIGNGFFSNLYGMFDALTMDRWLVRTWGRWTGTLVEFNPELTELAKNRLQETINNLTPEDKARMDAMIKNDISQMGLEYLSLAIQKASMKPEMRQLMNTTATGEEFRKAGNGYAKYLDGQKEAPSGPTERNFIREIFGLMLDELKSYPKYKDLTMADLQAVLWYAEKRLYETAKIKSDQDSLDSSDADGYEDDDAPDYANAAIGVARKKGVSEKKIQQVLENIKNDRTTTTRPETIEGNQLESEQQKSAGGFVGKEKQKFKQYVAVTTARRNRTGNEEALWTYARRSGSDSGELRVLKPKSKKNLGVKYISEWKPGRKLATMFRNNELPPVKFLELDSTDKASAQKFADTLQQSKESSPHGASVYVYPAEDYQGMNLFLSDSGKSGFAVKPDGDIVSVFSMEKGSGRSVMEAAIAAGGKKLDAFDTILPEFYGTHGFVEAARIPWNDEFAPDGWDKQTFKKFNNGEPDVVMMVLDPKFEGAYEPRTDVYTTEYDQAVKMQNSMLKKMEPKRK